MVKENCHNITFYVNFLTCFILEHYIWGVRVKTTLAILQNDLFRSNRNEMQEEFKTLKFSLYYKSIFLQNVTAHSQIQLVSTVVGIRWLCYENNNNILRGKMKSYNRRARYLEFWSFIVTYFNILISNIRSGSDESWWDHVAGKSVHNSPAVAQVTFSSVNIYFSLTKWDWLLTYSLNRDCYSIINGFYGSRIY